MNYGRWATTEELKDVLKGVNLKTGVQKSGTPIMYDDEYLYIDDNGSHNLVVGSTGSGKTQSITLPMIKLSLLAGESVLVNDPMGEMYTNTAKKFEEEGYEVILLNFDDPKYGNNWNPLKLPYDLYKNGDKDRAMKLLEDIGYYLFRDGDKSVDPFWTNTAVNYFTGLTLYLFEHGKSEEINMVSISNLSKDVNKDPNKFMKSIDKNSVITACLSGTLLAPPETKGSILSVFSQKMKLYITRETLTSMLANSDFDIIDICNKKVAIFMVSKLSHYVNSFISLFISQVIESISLYGKKEKSFNMIIEDFDEIVPIQDFARTLTYCRGLRIRITAIIRSYALLNKMYGKEEAEMLKICFGNIIYLLSDDIYTLNEISENCGNIAVGKAVVPLITPEELKTLKTFEAVVLKTRMMPIKTKMLPDYQIDWGYEAIPKEMPLRESKNISIFELKEI